MKNLDQKTKREVPIWRILEYILIAAVLVAGLSMLAWIGDDERKQAAEYKQHCNEMVASGTWPKHKCK